MEEQEIGRIKKTDATSVVIRINEFQGEKGVDIREFVETNKYTGLTKKGTRIPVSIWPEFKKLIDKVEL
nr:transcriptional coactivator p15/PC4 family protein [Nanoarchaeota archaeon]